ncbi:MAG: hypothetical protein OHK0046_10510 [Anaerolineae bacterium]
MSARNLALVILILAVAGCSLPTSVNNDEQTTISGAPEVRIASPLPNATFLEGVAVNIQAAVTNAGEDIDRVEILVEGVNIATLPSPNPAGAGVFNVTQTWVAPEPGTYTISLTAFRAGGTSSAPATVTVNIISQAEDTPTPTETAPVDPNSLPPAGATSASDGAATNAPAVEPTAAGPTETPRPTDTPAPTEPTVPIARFVNGINVRSGPGTNFNPPIGQFTANQEAEVLALNLDGSWLKVRYGTGEGWVFANLVEIVGDIASLPREAGPPTPFPTNTPLPTAIPATATSAVTNNLVPVEPFINPPQPNCGQPFTVGVTIRNDGSGNLNTGLTRIQVVRVADGQVIRSSDTALVSVPLAAGGTHRVTFTFTIDVFVGETHRVEFIADVNNEVPETIETDNRISVDYPMPANCP